MPESEASHPTMRDLVHLLNTFEEQGALAEQEIFLQVQGLGPNCLQELGNRLIRPSVPAALKRCIYGLPIRLPWPAWTPVLQRALMTENDAEMFEEGLRSLALLGGPEQTNALRAIAYQRVEEPFTTILNRKLEWLESRQGFEYHLKDLLQAGRNPSLALRAADHLALICRAENLAPLQEAALLEDVHVSRHAFRVIASLREPEAGAFLTARFEEMGAALEDGRHLREALEPLRKLSPKAQAEQLMKRVAAAMQGRAAAALESLNSALAEEGGNPAPSLERLKAEAVGGYEPRLIEALEIVLSDRPGRLGTLTAQVAEELRRGAPRLHGNLSECSLGLVQQTRLGILQEGAVVERLAWAYARGLGGDSVAWALATLTEARDERGLDLILQNPDHRAREAALTVLGEREDPDLLSFLFRATQDPIADLALKVTQYFGRLPGAFQMTMDLLHSGAPDKFRQALRIVEANAMRAACEPLLALLEETPREDLLCEGARTLGLLRYQPALPELLKLLHDGQSAKVQNALGETLKALALPEAALGLLDKCQQIRNPDLHLHAIQGLGAVFQEFDDPIPLDWKERVVHSLKACLDEDIPHRLAAIEAMPSLWMLSTDFYEGMLRPLEGHLAEQRKRPSWDRGQIEMAGSVHKVLEQRLGELAKLASSASQMGGHLAKFPADGRCDPIELRALLGLAGPQSPLWQWPGLHGELEALVSAGLLARGQDPRTLVALCELASRLRTTSCTEAAHALYRRTGPESLLRATLGELLRRTGDSAILEVTEPVPENVLILEPNAFFRRKLTTCLQDRGIRIREAQDRFEADALLDAEPAEVLVSESADAAGPLYDWIMAQWRGWKIQRVLLSTSLREPREVRQEPWFHGSIAKPYRSEMLLDRLRF